MNINEVIILQKPFKRSPSATFSSAKINQLSSKFPSLIELRSAAARRAPQKVTSLIGLQEWCILSKYFYIDNHQSKVHRRKYPVVHVKQKLFKFEFINGLLEFNFLIRIWNETERNVIAANGCSRQLFSWGIAGEAIKSWHVPKYWRLLDEGNRFWLLWFSRNTFRSTFDKNRLLST